MMRTTAILEELECYHDISISEIAFILGVHENMVWRWNQHMQEPTPPKKAMLERLLKRLNNSHRNP